jgi:hypothetical protein
VPKDIAALNGEFDNLEICLMIDRIRKKHWGFPITKINGAIIYPKSNNDLMNEINRIINFIN